MPIFEIVFSRPLATPLTTFHWAFSKLSTSGTWPSATSASSDSSSRYGLIAEQP